MISRLKDLLVALAVLLLGRRRRDDGPSAARIVPAGSPDRRAETWVLALFGLATAGGVAFLVVYALDPVSHRTQLLALALGGALAVLAAACIVIANRLVVTEEIDEPYPAPEGHGADQEAVAQLVAESGERITRRRLLTLGGAAAGGTLGLALLAPALALGPVFDTDELTETPWRRGRALVDESGRRIAADEIEEDAFYTAFPEGADRETIGAPLVVVRLSADALHLPADRRGWAPDGIVAYSKICTHAGCAIALYRKPTFPAVEPRPAFVCPCHYSTFDPATGGTVLFGPAGRALPQLPLSIDRSGNLRAAGSFSGPVGPSWSGVRSRKARGS